LRHDGNVQMHNEGASATLSVGNVCIHSVRFDWVFIMAGYWALTYIYNNTSHNWGSHVLTFQNLSFKMTRKASCASRALAHSLSDHSLHRSLVSLFASTGSNSREWEWGCRGRLWQEESGEERWRKTIKSLQNPESINLSNSRTKISSNGPSDISVNDNPIYKGKVNNVFHRFPKLQN
jgi:hypothetical protein